MKMNHRRLPSSTLTALLPLLLAACNGRLDVMTEGVGGTAGSGGSGQGGGGTPSLAGAAGDGGGAGGTSSDTQSCTDGVQSGDEADVDCGGASCSPCPTASRCTGGSDCASAHCVDGVCSDTSCDDGIRNGDEEGVDCGGTSGCPVCVERCACASSAALMPLGCDPVPGRAVGISGIPALSDDGSIVAFDICDENSRCQPLYWTASTGARTLPVPGGGATIAGLSGDGLLLLASPQVTLGTEATLYTPGGAATATGLRPAPALLSGGGSVFGVSPTGSGTQLMRREPGGELTLLGTVPQTADFIQLSAATPDGSMVVGHSADNQPFRWTLAGGLVLGLDDLPETADGATIGALSRSGEAFAGVTTLGFARVSVYRWTPAGGVVELAPAITSNTPGVNPFGMKLSDDGSVLAFSGETDQASQYFGAFRWTAATGVVALVPGIQSVAWLMSGDGSVIVGNGSDSGDYRAFFWTEQRGARSIRSVLEAAGVDFSGWTIDVPYAISRDGKVIAGIGTCGGVPTTYRMVLPE
jgi:hypothetical protein